MAAFNDFYDAFTAKNSALPDGQVLADGVVCARLITVMRGLGAEIAAAIKAEMVTVDKTDLDATAEACRAVLTDFEANRVTQLMLSGQHDAGRALLSGAAATDPRRDFTGGIGATPTLLPLRRVLSLPQVHHGPPEEMGGRG